MAQIANVIWQDRKRILGMPITFTKYTMSEDRLFLQTGLLNLKSEELLLYRVRDISMQASLLQRIFGVGTIFIDSSDQTTPKLQLINVKAPWRVKEQIHAQVEEMKMNHKVRFGELLDRGCTHDSHEEDFDFEDNLD